MKKALYISYTGMTEPLGQSQVLSYMRGLSDEFKIHIISTEKKGNFEKGRGKIEKICAIHNIDWHPMTYHSFPPLISKVFDYNNILQKARYICKHNKIELIHCRSYIPSLIGLKLKKELGTPFIFDMRGFWADERLEGNIWSLSNPIYKKIYQYFKRKELEFLTDSDYIISLTHNGKNEIESWGIDNSPIGVIPTCADVINFDYNLINKEELINIKSKLELNENFPIISYLGSTGTWYLLDKMLLAFKYIKEEYSSAKFLFITRDDKDRIIQQGIKQGLGASDFVFISGGREQMPLYNMVADINLFFIKPSFSKKASAPTKLGEVMALGLPIIANTNVGDVDAIVTNEIGHLVDTNSSEELINISKKIEHLVLLDKIAIREKSINLFSLEKGVSDYRKIYSFISEKNSKGNVIS